MKLIRATSTHNKKIIFVIAAHLAAIYPADIGGCYLVLSSGDEYKVDEDADSIADQLV